MVVGRLWLARRKPGLIVKHVSVNQAYPAWQVLSRRCYNELGPSRPSASLKTISIPLAAVQKEKLRAAVDGGLTGGVAAHALNRLNGLLLFSSFLSIAYVSFLHARPPDGGQGNCRSRRGAALKYTTWGLGTAAFTDAS